jgi:hypothetical protein
MVTPPVFFVYLDFVHKFFLLQNKLRAEFGFIRFLPLSGQYPFALPGIFFMLKCSLELSNCVLFSARTRQAYGNFYHSKVPLPQCK